MPDAGFCHRGHVLNEESEVFEAEVVACVDPEVALCGCLCGGDEWLYCALGVGCVVGGIGLGVELDAVGACACCIFSHLWYWVDEY